MPAKCGYFRIRWFKCFATSVIAFCIAIYLLNFSSYSIWERQAHSLFLSLIPANLSTLPIPEEQTCNCVRPSPTQLDPSRLSTCDDTYASARGPHQNVISYALYGSLTGDYFRGVLKNAEEVAKLYPGWVMRVYHSVDTGQLEQMAAICDLWCNFTHLDFCQVGRLPEPLGDQSSINGMVWRFFVLGDPLVDRFMVRDLDSIPSQRELAAVNDWIKSNYTFHFMHDNVQHNVPILGGMWGGMNRDLKLTTAIRKQIIDNGRSYRKRSDQFLLENYLYPVAAKTLDYVNHDSYYCSTYANSRPWPTQREADLGFVGSGFFFGRGVIQQPCPLECRPVDHKEWIFC